MDQRLDEITLTAVAEDDTTLQNAGPVEQQDGPLMLRTENLVKKNTVSAQW